MPRDAMPHPAPAAEPTPAPAPAPAPAAAPVPPPAGAPPAPAAVPELAKVLEENDKLRQHNKKLVEERRRDVERVKSLETRFTEFGKALGLDPAKDDPAAIQAQREADTRAKAEKETRIERELLKELVTLGKPVPKKVADYLIWDAQRSSDITLGEDGAVSGVKEFVESAFKNGFSDLGWTPPPPTPPPAKPAADAQPRDPVWDRLKTFRDFTSLPAVEQMALRKKSPELYEALKRKK